MGCTGLEFLLSQGERVAGVITHPDDPGEKRWFRSLEELARASDVPVFFDDGERKGEMRGLVRGLEPHLILSFYFRRMIPKPVLDLAPKGALNLHGSLLPRLRGRAPLNWALVECEERSGVT